jgi:5-methylcytosine-specific restriction endonuclease McrA
MDPFATSHFSDDALLHNLKMLTAHDCRATAVMLTRIVEVEERMLFLKAGYPSTHGYCVHELHFSEGVAYKRVHAARAARQFPAVLLAVAEGRLHLRAVLMLAPHLTSESADKLVAAATHKTRFELQRLLAERFPHPDLPERLQAIPLPAPTPVPPPAPGPPNGLDPDPNRLTSPEQFDHGHRAHVDAPAPGPTRQHSPENAEPRVARPELKPLAPQRFAFQCTLDQETHDLFQDVRALMSHEVPTGEMTLVLKGALKLAKAQLEKRKCAATDRPGRSRGCTSTRRIPAAVKRAVWERDRGQCTFVSESGRRCQERARLEYDHAEPVARGGQATAENVRLLCRAHNQYAAERAFGADFMNRRRAEARWRR